MKIQTELNDKVVDAVLLLIDKVKILEDKVHLLESSKKCKKCGGSGKWSNSGYYDNSDCPACNGKGY